MRFSILIGVLIVLRLLVMAFTPLLEPSESRYAAMSANMARTGDFVVPHFTYNDLYQSFDGKPPLVFQAGGVFCKLFGINEFAVRLFPFLTGVFLGWLIYWVVRRRTDEARARTAVLVYGSSTAFYVASGFAMTDVPLAAVTAGALLLYWCWLAERRWAYAAGIAALLGAGMIIKGPVSLALFGLPVFVDACVNRHWRSVFDWRWLVVLPVFLLIAVPWFVWVEQRNPGAVSYFFYNENFLRFLSPDYGDKYGGGRETFRGMALVWLLVATLPWVLIPVFQVLRTTWKSGWRAVRFDTRDFFIISVATITLFWCLTGRTLVSYLLPVTPIFAVALVLRAAPSLLARLVMPGVLVTAIGVTVCLAVAPFVSPKMEGPKGAYRDHNNRYAYEFYHGTPATALGPKLPDEDGTTPALASAPFPDVLSAYVWRNWFVVPHARLAEVVGAREADLEAMAIEMGLPAKVDVLPQWQTKGYITVLRRNWHLLNYHQLMRLLGLSRQELHFRLTQDDFLFVKLGRKKPFCHKLRYDAKAVARTRAERLKLGQMLKEEAADYFSEEPRFSFIDELARPTQVASSPSGTAPDSPFKFRMIFSYFADFVDPLADPEVGSYPEGLLQKLADDGVNAIWLHTVLRTLAKDPKYPEFGAGSEKRLENLQRLVSRAAKYGIRVYLYMNEPRGLAPEFFAADPARREFQGAFDDTGLYAMCTSVPEVRRGVADALTQVFSQVKGLGGIFTITASENLTNCASKSRKERCPRCANRPTAEIIAEINRTMIEGMRRGDPAAEAIVWNWAWNAEDAAKILAGLPKTGCRVMAVSEHDMAFTRGGVPMRENDYSISVVGPGPAAKTFWALAQTNGLSTVAKVQAGCSWELSAFPYLPVNDLVAEHAFNLKEAGVNGVMLSWSLGCAPSPNLKVFGALSAADTDKYDVERRIAAECYGTAAVPAVLQAWKFFADGFRQYPFSIGTVYYGPQQWGPANPLYWEPTGWSATMVGLPYDDLKGWCGGYPANVWIDQMGKVARGFQEGTRRFRAAIPLMPQDRRKAALREADMFEAESLHFLSSMLQARFIEARTKGDRDMMRKIARLELRNAKRMLALVRADSRFGYESSNQYFYTPQDLREKILTCRKGLEK